GCVATAGPSSMRAAGVGHAGRSVGLAPLTHLLLELLLAASTILPSHGTVRTDSLWSAALGVTKHYLVYLPPSYATSTTRRYPVAYYLHGLNGDETNWVQLGHLDAAMDSLIAGGGPEMIVVMPDGDNSWY